MISGGYLSVLLPFYSAICHEVLCKFEWVNIISYATKQDCRGDKKSGDDGLLWISSEICRTNSQDGGYRKRLLLES